MPEFPPSYDVLCTSCGRQVKLTEKIYSALGSPSEQHLRVAIRALKCSSCGARSTRLILIPEISADTRDEMTPPSDIEGDEIGNPYDHDNGPSERRCSKCRESIPQARLQIVPETHLCGRCQSENERDHQNRDFQREHPACPRCGRHAVKRKGPKGWFWGCSSYPRCTGTMPA